jgi:putative ABC transport system permease protein
MVWRQLTRGLRGLFQRRVADQDAADEVADYVAQAAAAHRARGLSPVAALRAARLEVGNLTGVREQMREAGWESVIDACVADVRYAVRRLRAAHGFTAVTVLTLALAIGATTAIFSAVNPILFEPLPYPHAGRIFVIDDYGTGGAPMDVTFGTYRELVQRSRSFDTLAVLKPWQPTITGMAEPERLTGQQVSAGYFRALDLQPAVGRDFDQAEDRPGGAKTVIVSDALFRRRLGADSAVIGRTVTLDGTLFTVIGVMPRGFENVLAPSADVWTLLQYDPSLPSFDGREWGHHLRLIARLRSSLSVDAARRELATIAHTPRAGFVRPPWASLDDGLQLTRLQDRVTQGVRAALLSVLGAVLLLLCIACGNVTNLLLARGAERKGEFAIRAALGAARPRLMRQLLTESLLLALVAGICGVAVAAFGVRALVALGPADLPRLAAIGLDAPAYLFAFAVTTVIGLAVGLVPALHASRGDLQAGLQQASRRSAGQHRTRRTLVVLEVSLALVLLVGAGLLVHSLARVLALPAGFDPSQVLTMQVQVAGPRFDADSATHRYYAQALEAVRQVPGVIDAAFTSQLPLSGGMPDAYGAALETSGGDAHNGDPAIRYAVTGDYFAALRIPLLRGRYLDRRDVAGAPRSVVISESYARRAFAGADPLGRRLRFGPDAGWLSIVGVVGDVKQSSLFVGTEDAFYIAPPQWVWADHARWLVVRGQGAVTGLVPALKRAIWSVDKEQPIVRVGTMDAWVAASTAMRRFTMIVFEVFALVALVLAATGIYGILAGGVTERRREIGVRAALGASRAEILSLVVRQGMGLTVAGMLIGLVAAGLASRALVTLLFGVSPLDPLTYLGMTALLGGVALAACGVPAWRAAQIDPAQTLRLDT